MRTTSNLEDDALLMAKRVASREKLSLTDDPLFNFERIHGHNQITDAYLLALAVRHGGTLVTIDRAITLDAVRGARPQHLQVL